MSKFKVTTETQREMDRYRLFMLEHEYTPSSAIGYCAYLSRFLRWPLRESTKRLQENIIDFLTFEREHNLPTYKNCRAALYLYFKMIEGKDFPITQSNKYDQEIEVIVKGFYDYSVNIKRIKISSAIWEVSCVRNFLVYALINKSCHLKDITAHDIHEFVFGLRAHLKASSKGREVTALRNFFKFQKFEGMPVHESIFQLPLSPAIWKSSAFPVVMPENIFNDLHMIPDLNTPTGKRNRCIILCFTEIALRCIEVAELTLDDFNWRESSVTINNTKNHIDRKLPISEKLGQALAEYIKTARPQTASRVLFVRFKHPRGEPMGCSQIRGVVRRIYKKSGADLKSTGTHILRRTAATKIYNAGNSLKMTADILGHESLDSTVRYAKVDISRLLQAASPWPSFKVGEHDD
jgi:site-specific recombinase XerD